MKQTIIAWLALVAAVGCDDKGPEGPGEDAGDVEDGFSSADADARCAVCGPDELCVQTFDGVCGEISVRCVTATVGCPDATCSEACDDEICNAGGDPGQFTCSSGGCPGELPGALRCYGP